MVYILNVSVGLVKSFLHSNGKLDLKVVNYGCVREKDKKLYNSLIRSETFELKN